MTEVDGILRDFAQIGMGLNGGLIYRIERSRSYAASFLDTLPHLRITRIAGWQPYDDFINRYIGLLFGRIHRLGLQYDDLGQRIDRLIGRERAQQFDDYQKSVKATLAHLDELTLEMRKNSEEMRMIGEQQVSLLDNAERFAIIFSVYYIGSILRDALYDPPRIISLMGYKIGFSDYYPDYNLVWIVVMIGLLLYKMFQARRKRAKGRL